MRPVWHGVGSWNPVTSVSIGRLVRSARRCFAVGDWIAVPGGRRRRRAWWRRVEYVCKPATVLALIVAAAALDPAAGADARQRWFVAALVFSLAGDVLLMLPRDQFVGGLSAFFVAHCCYLAGFWSRGPALVPLLAAVVVAAVDRAARRASSRAVRSRDPGPGRSVRPTWW